MTFDELNLALAKIKAWEQTRGAKMLHAIPDRWMYPILPLSQQPRIDHTFAPIRGTSRRMPRVLQARVHDVPRG